jgi:hypothetical protein
MQQVPENLKVETSGVWQQMQVLNEHLIDGRKP